VVSTIGIVTVFRTLLELIEEDGEAFISKDQIFDIYTFIEG